MCDHGVCVHVCVWVIVHMQVCVYVDACMPRGLMLTLESLLMAVHCILGHGLLLDPGITHMSGLASQLVLGDVLSSPSECWS